jgi:hypothetical protein
MLLKLGKVRRWQNCCDRPPWNFISYPICDSKLLRNEAQLIEDLDFGQVLRVCDVCCTTMDVISKCED